MSASRLRETIAAANSPDGPQWTVGQDWSKSHWPCRCTAEELLATAKMDSVHFYTRDGGVYRPEILASIFVYVTPEDKTPPYANPKASDIVLIRLVCAKVLEHRARGNRMAEMRALQSVTGQPLRWGRRPRYLDAVSYLMRTVCPHVEWDGARLPRKKLKRMIREVENPLDTLADREARRKRNMKAAARRVAKKKELDTTEILR